MRDSLAKFGPSIGIATTSNPLGVRTLLHSLRNPAIGLKCCAVSKATIVSMQLSANGNLVAAASTKDIELVCSTFLFTT